MDIALMQGRPFSWADHDEAPGVLIVNETMARQYWPEKGGAMGKRIRFGREEESDEPWLTIIGVVSDVHHSSLSRSPRPEMYLPLAQQPRARMIVVARSVTTDATSLINSAKEAVWEIDPELPVYRIRTMAEVVDRRMGGEKASAHILGVVSFVALLLATVGIYGVISYGVSERTQEIGVRTALGAGHRDILVLVLRQALFLVGLGVAIGLVGALASLQILSSMLFGVSPSDPATYVIVTSLLAGVALVASLLPARRASRVDPVIALRYE